MPDLLSPAEYPTLYQVLAEPALSGGIRGETKRTAAKETIDDDREAFPLEGFIPHA